MALILVNQLEANQFSFVFVEYESNTRKAFNMADAREITAYALSQHFYGFRSHI